jgi:cell division protein FtsN
MAKPAARKKSQGASRNSRAPVRKSVPGWLWMLLGLAAGLFVAFLWHLSELRKAEQHKTALRAEVSEKSTTSGNDATTTATKTGTEKPPVTTAAKEPRFDFYTLLPNQQVMPNAAANNTANGSSNNSATKAGSASQTPATSASTPDSKTPTKAVEQTPYLLQAGSFQSEAEAEKRRVSILLLGLPVKIQKAPLGTGATWYRVVVGPVKGQEAAHMARANLRSNGIESVMMKKG